VDTTDVIEKQIADLEAKLALETDAVEQYKLQTKIIELQNDLYDEQIDKIKQLAGYVDVENVIQQQAIGSMLRASGLSGMDLNDALTELGIVGSGVGDTVNNSPSGRRSSITT
jgi:hypothetical protein